MGETRDASPTFSDNGDIICHVHPHFFFRFHNILVSHQAVPLTFYNKIAPMAVSRGVTRGGKGGATPRAPSNYGGAKSVRGRLEVPTMSQALSSLQKSCFGKTSVSNMGRQTCFLPRAPSNLVTPLAVSNQKWCNGHCFTATCENEKIHYGAFLFLTLLPRLTELSKVFQAGCFNLAQMKASVELCITKLSDAAAKSELKADWERRVNYGTLERWMV